jgi:hypothetical protein
MKESKTKIGQVFLEKGLKKYQVSSSRYQDARTERLD